MKPVMDRGLPDFFFFPKTDLDDPGEDCFQKICIA